MTNVMAIEAAAGADDHAGRLLRDPGRHVGRRRGSALWIESIPRASISLVALDGSSGL
jgi:hypothetical protein